MMKRYRALVQVAIINYILSWSITHFSTESNDLYSLRLNVSYEFEM